MPTVTRDTEKHPILFNEWSLRGILDGRKTQTRRIVKPQPHEHFTKAHVSSEGRADLHVPNKGGILYDCPYGKSGDVLMGREAFRLLDIADDQKPSDYVKDDYIRDMLTPIRYEADKKAKPAIGESDWGRLRPSIHIPYKLVRLKLRLENVRVERVQSITHDDAVAEGVTLEEAGDVPIREKRMTAHQHAFAKLWDDINGEREGGAFAWERDPWCWVLEFSRID